MIHKDFLTAIAKESIKNGYNVKEYHKGNKNKISCDCPECSFTIEYIVNEYSEVTVTKDTPHVNHKRETVVRILNSFVRVFIGSIIREDLSLKETKQRLIEYLDVTEDIIDFSTVSSALSRIKDRLFGQKSTLKFIDSFADAYNRDNGTNMEVMRNAEGEIESVFIDFSYSAGFSKISNQIVFLDGTHSKSSYKATILMLCCPVCTRSAVPIAILWCNAENIQNTRLLFEKAGKHLNQSCIIKSDEAQCFITVVKEFGYRHSLCCYHIKAKLRSTYLLSLFNRMYETYSVDTFNKLATELSKSAKSMWKNIEGKLGMVFRLEGAPPSYDWESSSPIESINSAFLPYRKRSLLLFCVGVIRWCRDHVAYISAILTEMKKSGSMLHTSVQNIIQRERDNGNRRFMIDKSTSTNDIIHMKPRRSVNDADMDAAIYVKGCNSVTFSYKSTPKTKSQEAYLAECISSSKPVCTCKESSFTGLPCQHMASILSQDLIESVICDTWKRTTYEFLIGQTVTVPDIDSLDEMPSVLAKQRQQPGRPRMKRLTYNDSSVRTARVYITKGFQSLSSIRKDITDLSDMLMDHKEYPLLYQKFVDILCLLDKAYHEYTSNCSSISRRASKTIEKLSQLDMEFQNAKGTMLRIYDENYMDMLSLFKKDIEKDPLLSMKGRLSDIHNQLWGLRMMEGIRIVNDYKLHIEDKLLFHYTEQ